MVSEKINNTEQAILHAAEQEFMEHGHDGAKMMNIARRAGVTHAMLHYYFRTKDNLFDMVVRRKMEALIQNVVKAFTNQDDESLVDRIIHGMQVHFDFISRERDLARFVISHIMYDEQRCTELFNFLKQSVKGLTDRLQREIDEKVAQGEFQPVRALDLLLDMVSLNVFPFIARPAVELISQAVEGEDYAAMVASRKQEIARVISNRLLRQPS